MKPLTWVILLGVAALLWLAARGRLADTVYAMEHGGTKGTGGSGGAGSTGTPLGGFSGMMGDTNFGHLFGFDPTNSRTESRYLEADKGLVPGAAEEWNLFTGGKSLPFTLPPGHTWQLVTDVWDAGVGGEEAWKDTTTGAEIGFLHLQKGSGLAPGARVKGGRVVGMTGWPLDPAYGNGVAGSGNAHLAVILDSAAMKELGI